jgi:uncharacterized protein (UPF0332 family)
VNGELFLHTARFLLSNGRNEADFRSAISRAYYACFLVTRKIAFDNCSADVRLAASIRNERGIKHNKLPEYLKHASRRDVQQLGRELDSLCHNREDADYQMTGTISAQDAQDAVALAESLLQDISRIPAGEIGRSMEGYIRQVYPMSDGPTHDAD